MTASEFVSASPVAYDAGTAFPASLAVTTPPDARFGDRLLMFVVADARTTVGAANLNSTTPAGWTLLASQNGGATGNALAPGTTGKIWTYTRRYELDYAEPTVVVTKSSSIGTESYAAIMLAYRPSKPVTDQGGTTQDAATLVWKYEAIAASLGAYDSTIVVLEWRTRSGGTLSGSGPTLPGTNTLRVSESGVTGRYGDLRIKDTVVTTNYSLVPNPPWTPGGASPITMSSVVMESVTVDERIPAFLASTSFFQYSP